MSEYAFPRAGATPSSSSNEYTVAQQGMTLRDYFAAHALGAFPIMQYNINTARKAYEIADAMLEARKE